MTNQCRLPGFPARRYIALEQHRADRDRVVHRFAEPARAGRVVIDTENRPHEFISIKHIGMINKGVEDTESEEVKKWVPAFENYTFKEEDGQTTVVVEMDTNEEYDEMFEKIWPKTLDKLKALCE